DIQAKKEMAMLAALRELNQKRQEEMNRQKEKDLQRVEIRHSSGRISMMYLPKKTVEHWREIRKANPKMTMEEAMIETFKQEKNSEK
ncbi:hypothetical protein, partial [Prevotella sp.]|uniref:hypothetical protein n=1 Tax=Prevotella sp. TaxID=59823 RepID=UPI00307AB89A